MEGAGSAWFGADRRRVSGEKSRSLGAFSCAKFRLLVTPPPFAASSLSSSISTTLTFNPSPSPTRTRLSNSRDCAVSPSFSASKPRRNSGTMHRVRAKCSLMARPANLLPRVRTLNWEQTKSTRAQARHPLSSASLILKLERSIRSPRPHRPHLRPPRHARQGPFP